MSWGTAIMQCHALLSEQCCQRLLPPNLRVCLNLCAVTSRADLVSNRHSELETALLATQKIAPAPPYANATRPARAGPCIASLTRNSSPWKSNA